VRIASVPFVAPSGKEVIVLPKTLGTLSAVQIAVAGADVEIADLKLTYGNGQVDDIPVRSMFKAGSASRVIPLPGVNGRFVKNVIVVYRAFGRARLEIMGSMDTASAGGGANAWVQLGCQPVGFRVDHDAIAVGGQEGGFRAVRLRVEKAPVEFFDLVVTFGNGQQQRLAVRAAIPAGGMTRAIDLAGQVRGIRRIDMLYRSIPTFAGQAKVCADGLSAP
jgi:hypothetical protein